jgi:hypothetical protein
MFSSRDRIKNAGLHSSGITVEAPIYRKTYFSTLALPRGTPFHPYMRLGPIKMSEFCFVLRCHVPFF